MNKTQDTPFRNRLLRRISLCLAVLLLVPICAQVSCKADAKTQLAVNSRNSRHRKPVTRLFWQDRSDDSLKWADLYLGSTWELSSQTVDQFPKLDVEKQDLVQMNVLNGTLLVGVRDQENGKFQSGWVAVKTGVREVPHGFHSDWIFDSLPTVKCSRLDKEQGNPAHLYTYDDKFYLANDQKNGFTVVDPNSIGSSNASGQFFLGGGNHITMAAADGLVGYSTWIDGGGPNKGRVDVVNLQKSGEQANGYSFFLPSGVIHGATENSGRVFFAPSDGVCWVSADRQLKQKADSVEVHHISLGKDEQTEKPLRTGGFTNHRNWVLFVTKSDDYSALCLVDAKASKPTLVKVPIPVSDGLTLTTPRVVQTYHGKRYAFIFHDRKGGELEEKLTVIDLDPNRDRNLSDARIVKSMTVGASKVEGHHGHHAICFDSDGKYAAVTNPGDGTIWVLSLHDLSISGKLQVGGIPTAICGLGALSHH